jgi:hypothetical protein
MVLETKVFWFGHWPAMRLSDSIDRRQAANLQAAFHHAVTELPAIGCPLNQYAVSAFHYAEPWEVGRAFEVLRRNHLSRWLRHHTGGRTPPYFIWCIENAATPYGSNLHANLVVHIPRPLQAQFRMELPLWLARVTNTVAVPANAVHVQPVDDDRGGLPGLKRYFLKGVAPELAARYGVERLQKEHGPQGLVLGKRCGVSQSLGPRAREQHTILSMDSRWAA